MPTIDQLSQATSLSGADEVALYSSTIGTTVKATLDQVASVVLQSIEGEPDGTVYSIPSGTVALLPAAPGAWFWALLTLSVPVAALTVILPGVNDRAHGQEVLVTCTQTVTALTVNGNGAALSGAPTTAGPTAHFRMKFDSISSTWYRI